MNMKKVLLSIVMLMAVLCLTVNIAYADDEYAQVPTTTIDDLGGNTKDTLDIGTPVTPTQPTIDLGVTTETTKVTTTSTTATTTTASTVTTLPHTGATETTGVLVTIMLLAVVGIVSFKVIKNNSDIK